MDLPPLAGSKKSKMEAQSYSDMSVNIAIYMAPCSRRWSASITP